MLSGTVEADDSFFGAAHEGSRRGRRTDKTPAVFGLSLDALGCKQRIKTSDLQAG